MSELRRETRTRVLRILAAKEGKLYDEELVELIAEVAEALVPSGQINERGLAQLTEVIRTLAHVAGVLLVMASEDQRMSETEILARLERAYERMDEEGW